MPRSWTKSIREPTIPSASRVIAMSGVGSQKSRPISASYGSPVAGSALLLAPYCASAGAAAEAKITHQTKIAAARMRMSLLGPGMIKDTLSPRRERGQPAGKAPQNTTRHSDCSMRECPAHASPGLRFPDPGSRVPSLIYSGDAPAIPAIAPLRSPPSPAVSHRPGLRGLLVDLPAPRAVGPEVRD